MLVTMRHLRIHEWHLFRWVGIAMKEKNDLVAIGVVVWRTGEMQTTPSTALSVYKHWATDSSHALICFRIEFICTIHMDSLYLFIHFSFSTIIRCCHRRLSRSYKIYLHLRCVFFLLAKRWTPIWCDFDCVWVFLRCFFFFFTLNLVPSADYSTFGMCVAMLCWTNMLFWLGPNFLSASAQSFVRSFVFWCCRI